MGDSELSLLIVADVGSEHFHVGDEAMLEANLQGFRRHAPGVRLAVRGRGAPGTDERAQLASALRTASALFISGGGNLRSTWPGLLQQRIDALREARRLGIPVLSGGQTIGPDLTRLQRDALAGALAGIRQLGVRELPSASLALSMGVESDRLTYQVDDAFFLTGHRPPDQLVPAALARPFVAVTLDASFGAASASDELASLARQFAAVAREFALDIVFMPHVGPIRRIGDEDGRAGIALRELLARDGVACEVLPVLGSAETVWVTQRAAAVVSSRYHPLVFASAAAVPALGIHRDAYTRVKLQGALRHVGMAAWSISVAGAAAGELDPALRRLWGERESIRSAIAAALGRITVAEQRRWELLVARLGHGAAGELAAQASPLPSLPGWRRGRSTRLERVSAITAERWNDYERDGFLRLDDVLDPDAVAELRERADELATGRVSNPDVEMDPDGAAIHGVETDDRFTALVHHPVFLEIAARQYGRHAAVSTFRAMVTNEPARRSATPRWHQDGGEMWALDRDPLVTVWVALDDTTPENGGLEVVPGSHRLGLLTPQGGALGGDDVEQHCVEAGVVPLALRAGDGVLMHSWLIRRSGVNGSDIPCRAFTTCYVDARTRSTLTGQRFPLVAGARSDEPDPFVRLLQDDANALRRHVTAVDEYAVSLRDANARLQESLATATAYARSLEDDRARVVGLLDDAQRRSDVRAVSGPV